MAAQMNYSYSTPKGVPGGKYDLSYDEVVTRINEEADGIMQYGLAVVVGTNAGGAVKRPASGANANDFEGIVLHTANTEQDMSGKVVVKKGVALNIMKRGKVWGRIASNAKAIYGKAAYVVVSGEEAGCFTDSSEGTINIGAKFGAVTDNGISVIEIK